MAGRTRVDADQLHRLVVELRSMIDDHFGFSNTGTANSAADLGTFRGPTSIAQTGVMDGHTGMATRLHFGMHSFADTMHQGTSNLAAAETQNHQSLAARGAQFAHYNHG